MTADLVTVVIPCYNASAYIEAAIASAWDQRTPGIVDVEVLVVDDASTDDSAAKVEAAAAANPGMLRLLRQPQNQGPAAARNRGLRMSAGGFVCFLDADDQYVPGFFSWAVRQFRQHPRVAAISTGVELVNCHRQIASAQRRAIIRSLPSNIIIKTAVAQLLGGFPDDPVFRGKAAGEDFIFRNLLVRTFEVAHTEAECLRYLVRPGSHFDFFLDRTEVVDDRLVFRERSSEESSPDFTAAIRRYEQGCAARVTAASGSLLASRIDDPRRFEDLDQFDSLRSQFEDVDGFLHPLEGYALYQLARAGPSTGKIVEIGSFMGRSTCWLAAGTKAAGRRPVVAVDHFHGSPEHQIGGSHAVEAIATVGSTSHIFENNIQNKGLSAWVEVQVGDSSKVVETWSDPVRLLFIDGDHSYEATRRDFECWSPFCNEQGLVAFHDVDVWPGVTEFYTGLLAAGGWREFLRVRSLRVVQRAE
jgi:glycosyltransferase involved in cell wall biosynthesis